MKKNGVLVVGSANMDMVVATARFPHPGETVFGGRFGMFPGGKGANQAVACAKLGLPTHFIGKMGNDVFRDTLMASMRRDGVRLNHVMFDAGKSTGIALITVDRGGQNEIVVVSGSNMKLLPEDLERHRAIFSAVQVVLLQLEIPLPTVVRGAELARTSGAMVILNPAPAQKLPRSLLKMVDFLTPNETEAEILTGLRVRDLKSAESAAQELLRIGVKHVIVTLGKRGCLFATPTTTRVFPALRVKPVDTTAAGDAFNGALAYGLASGRDLHKAIRFANSVAAFAVTRMGAQSSMPTMKELRAFTH
jgi:ribokinase